MKSRRSRLSKDGEKGDWLIGILDAVAALALLLSLLASFHK
jgi:hypothetical protein